jgi:drug/metabolite transporter (DMT)-like permease
VVDQNSSRLWPIVSISRFVCSHEESEKYFISAGVAVMQLFKTVVSLFLLRFLDSKGYSSTSEALSDVWQVTKSDLVGTMNVIFVCSAYVAQNFMYFAAAHYVDTTVFLVISQMKTLTAAVFAVLLANRVISLVQWVSLVMLMAGVCMVQVSWG